MATDLFRDGKDAHARGAPKSACPHPEGKDERAEWLGGWNEAMNIAARADLHSPSSEPLDALRSAGLVRPGAGPTGR